MATLIDTQKSSMNLSIELKRLKAIVEVSGDSLKVVYCTGRERCLRMGLLINGSCPKYCEIIVAVKDYITKRRKPKAIVTEL
jgi:hypothetical protein